MAKEMTREEAIEFGKMWLDFNDDSKDSTTYAFFELAIKALDHQPCEGVTRFEDARAEIEKAMSEAQEDCRDTQDDIDCGICIGLQRALNIIDK